MRICRENVQRALLARDNVERVRFCRDYVRRVFSPSLNWVNVTRINAFDVLASDDDALDAVAGMMADHVILVSQQNLNFC
ncbi:hypothetical protein [Olsenella phocaeensis]|uniref:hypothetical protein n=1 Tax=Olsenella phocaeensis TaxID=1852385 RepID=UPI0013564513|nr:hypothetical protein [Olsenella phocaeensis]